MYLGMKLESPVCRSYKTLVCTCCFTSVLSICFEEKGLLYKTTPPFLNFMDDLVFFRSVVKILSTLVIGCLLQKRFS